MDKVKLFMEKLNVSEEEAREIADYDSLIDKGAEPLPLSPSQKAVEKSVRQVARKVDAYGKSTERKHKSDEVKAGLIELFSEVVKEQPMCGQVEILNPEREFTFMWAEKKYKVVLSCPRS